MQEISIVWLRSDLRLADNPAFIAAAECGLPVLCLYIREPNPAPGRAIGAASKWWLDKSLRSLQAALNEFGGNLILQTADKTATGVFETIASQFTIKHVFWNRRYSPQERERDSVVKEWLKNHSIEAKSFGGNLLVEPWQIKTESGSPYKVFTPFWKSLKGCYVSQPTPKLPDLKFVAADSEDLNAWGLHPTKPDWSKGFQEVWEPGESGAMDALNTFLDDHLKGYSENRDRPDMRGTSRLSPHLAFGEISPSQIWNATTARIESHPELEKDGWSFLREVGWRDFSYSLLYQSEDLAQENWNDRFDTFEWTSDSASLTAWQKGQTGYPIVDAGMRELWHTGWMHNRVRMIVASFLTKHLLIDWREGEKWFWDTLVDADTANNPASWQWVAGSGADAAPYFRIFNPMTQGEKFDPDGDYIRQWVPELQKLPNKHLNQPWEAPRNVLRGAGIELGKDYPKPIVDHKAARERALETYKSTG